MSSKKPLRSKIASSVSRSAAALSRATGRGDGSVIGGRLGLMIDPNLLANLAAGRHVALISGTNGKTTTTRLTTAAMGVLGPVATNSLGANMPTGHTSALARAGDTPYAVLETDEHYLPQVLAATKPEVVALLNLSRDQLDRAKEVAMMAELWRDTLAANPVHVVANADDPMITWAARAAVRAGARATWVAAGQRWHDDSWVCPECGAHIQRAGAQEPADAPAAEAVDLPAPEAGSASTGSTGSSGSAASAGSAAPSAATASSFSDISEMSPAGDKSGADAPDDLTLVIPAVRMDDATVTMPAATDDATVTMPAATGDAFGTPAAPPAPATPAPLAATPPAGTPATAPNPATAGTPTTAPTPTAPGTPAVDPDDWWCTNCDLRRPRPDWRVEGDSVIDPLGRAHHVILQLPGRVNRANAATALAVADAFGVDAALAVPRLAEVASIAGRYAQVDRDGRNIRLLLAKNPAGWLEAFDMAEHAPTLLSINSRDPDGLDTSWLFDVDFSPLRGRAVYITGDRAFDLAVRLEVNDIQFRHVGTFGEAVAAVPPGRLEVIANYTAFQDIRAELDRVN